MSLVCAQSCWVYVCPVMRFIMLQGIELKLDRKVGDKPQSWWATFWSYPIKRHLEVNLPAKCLTAPNSCQKNPLPQCSALLGSKVTQQSAGVKQRSICLQMLCGNQIQTEESLYLYKLTLYTDQSTVQCWGQRSCRDQPGSTRSQFE